MGLGVMSGQCAKIVSNYFKKAFEKLFKAFKKLFRWSTKSQNRIYRFKQFNSIHIALFKAFMSFKTFHFLRLGDNLLIALAIDYY